MRLNQTIAGLTTVCVLAASLSWGALPAAALQRRKAVRVAPPAAAPPRPAGTDEGAKPAPMAAAFNSGRLPEAVRLPPGGDDERARALAQMVSARDGNSTAALYAALLAAGFGVRDADGSVVRTVEPGQGLAFEAWEVAAMAKMYGERRAVTLGELGSALSHAAPEMKAAPVSKFIASALRRHAREGGNPGLRFWARFVVELGRAGGRPDDLLAAREPEQVELDPVQAALILRRLFGDLYALGQKGGRSAARPPGGASPATRGPGDSGALFVRASYTPAAAPGAPPQQKGAAPPCKLEGDAGTVLDGMATVITTGFGELLGYLEEHAGGMLGKRAEWYAKFANVANILLAYAKLVATYAMLETKIQVQQPLPLVRTKSRVPGEKRQLTARVSMNVGNWQALNCVRTLLNVAAGLDFNLPNDGPVGGARVTWKLAPRLKDWSEASTREVQIVGFTGGRHIQDAGIGLIGTQPDRGISYAHETKTDDKGLSHVTLEGSPRRKPIMFESKAVPVMDEATVRTVVTLKAGDLKGDLVDLFGQATGGPLTLPAELFYRTSWASTAEATIPVKDWEECAGGWIGEVSYERVRDISRGDYVDRDEFNLTARVDEPGVMGYPGGITMLDVEARGRFKFGRETFRRGFCNGDYAKATVNLSGDTPLKVWLRIQGDEYQFSLRSPPIEAVEEREWAATNCPAAKVHQRQEFRRATARYGIQQAYHHYKGKIDPDNAGLITGSETEQIGDAVITVKWRLRRCA